MNPLAVKDKITLILHNNFANKGERGEKETIIVNSHGVSITLMTKPATEVARKKILGNLFYRHWCKNPKKAFIN